jgi:hypothetical protein
VALILVFLLAVVPVAPGVALANDTFSVGSNTYYVNGQAQTMDVAPYIENGRTMLPVRYVAEALGVSDSNIIYDPNSRKVTIINGGQVIQLTIGSNIMLINNAPTTMDISPEINDSHTFLPVAWVAQALGANISWDAGAQQVTIATGGGSTQQVTASTGGIGGQSNSQPVPATVTPQVPEPTMALYPGTSPISSGVFNGPQTVQVINNEGIIVYYTTDGSSPISSSTRIAYSGPFTVSQSETVNVATQDQYGNWSSIVSATFYINSSSQPSIVQPSIPSAPVQPTTITLSPYDSNNVEVNTYTWTSQGQQFSWTIGVPGELIENEAFTQVPKLLPSFLKYIFTPSTVSQQGQFNTIINDSASSQYISGVASELEQTAQSQGYGQFDEAAFITSFVQSIPYRIINDNVEYPPQVIANGGDCINTSVLLASILHQLGYQVAVMIFPSANHAVAGIAFPGAFPGGIVPGSNLTFYTKNGLDYYYTDTTAPGYLIGQNSLSPNLVPKIYPIQ